MSLDLRSLSRTCGGAGWLDCECGGDFCVCLLSGGMDCPGCEDCREPNDYDEANDIPDCPASGCACTCDQLGEPEPGHRCASFFTRPMGF